MSARSVTAVQQLNEAAQLLEATSGVSPLPKAVAAVLRAEAHHWQSWFPSDPSRLDRAMVNLAKTVIDTHTPTTGADAGPRQHKNTEKKG